MRIVFIALAVMSLAWLIAAAQNDTAAPPPAPPSRPTVNQHELHDCRDLCEQTTIVEQLTESALAACRARCQERLAPLPPNEPIRRITVAPADHRRTVRSEPTAR